MFSSKLVLLIFFFLGASCDRRGTNETGVNQPVLEVFVRPSPTPSEYLDMLKQNPVVLERSDRSRLLTKYVGIDGLIFVGSTSIHPPSLEHLDQKLGLGPEVLEDFEKKNESLAKIDPLFDVYGKVELIDLEGRAEDKLAKLVRKYPKSNGIVLFSQIGRNAELSQRLIYVEYYPSKGKSTKEFCSILWNQALNDLKESCVYVDDAPVLHP